MVIRSFAEAVAKRDAAMEQALSAAERQDDEWPELAYGFLYRYAQRHQEFEAWHVTQAAERMGYGAPTTDRAWGSIFRKAIREGVMTMVGLGKNPNRHASMCPRYRSMVFGGNAA
ncbi:tartrate dehydratase beta subunit/fumarate hydratase class I family protein [Dyella sp. SG562]|uniref:hypothetical protein n=1 Tax=Dyella sp. SG562 TaxID=2587017 RepID=UPI00141E655C|nr:hypothetical protein [Dyella sp. SG562]NII73937.1 tartrate dehydratase beta subunit/fumarate hydratase class I family protein [Dyella sp. SG562]